MKRSILLLTILAPVLFTACEELDKITTDTGLTNEEVIEGLKSALTVGSDTSVNVLSALDGYYSDEAVKILLPDEAQPIYKNISKVPGGQALLDAAILSINRSAEDAADAATPIFKEAITDITIEDGFNILNGDDTAATFYLKGKTYTKLSDAFRPSISASLNKTIVGNTSAESAYAALVGAYNKASLKGLLWDEISDNTLTDHTTSRALDGLFLKVGEEEGKIRNNVAHRVNDILKKVFGGE